MILDHFSKFFSYILSFPKESVLYFLHFRDIPYLYYIISGKFCLLYPYSISVIFQSFIIFFHLLFLHFPRIPSYIPLLAINSFFGFLIFVILLFIFYSKIFRKLRQIFSYFRQIASFISIICHLFISIFSVIFSIFYVLLFPHNSVFYSYISGRSRFSSPIFP